MELFDCKYREGRVETAPKLRAGASEKRRIAEADGDKIGALEAEEKTGSPSRARMPHNELASDELDSMFPSLQATDGPQLEDLVRLEDDLLYSAGMHEVQRIVDDMRNNGRTRHAACTEPRPVSSTTLDGGRGNTRYKASQWGASPWGLGQSVEAKEGQRWASHVGCHQG